VVPDQGAARLPRAVCDLSTPPRRAARRRAHPPRRSSARRADRAERPRAVHAAPRRVRPPRARRATRPQGGDPARCPRGGGRPDAGAWPPGLPRRRRRRGARGVAAAAEGIFGGTVRAFPEGVVGAEASLDRAITRVTASIRPAVKMHDGKDEDAIGLDSIENTVRKPPNEQTAERPCR